jgi:hypothetical protein
MLGLAAALFVGVAVVGGIVYRIKTDQGEVIIETVDSNVEVIIKRGGKQIDVNLRTQDRVKLQEGSYEVELKGNATLQLKDKTFTLIRGGQHILEITRKPADEPRKKPEETFRQTEKAPGSPLPQVVTDEFRVNTWTKSQQSWPAVAITEAGDYVVTWASLDQTREGWGVYGRLYDANDKPRGSEFLINTTTRGHHQKMRPRVAVDRQGNFLVAWSGPGNDGIGIYARRFDVDGRPRAPEFRVSKSGGDGPEAHSVAVDAQDRFIVAWFVKLGDKGWSCKAQRIEASGARDEEEIDLGRGQSPAVACCPDGQFAILFDPNPYGKEVCFQRFNPDGSRRGSQTMANAHLPGKRSCGNLAFDAQGNLVVVWNGEGEGDPTGIFSRRYDAAGVPCEHAEVLVNTHTSGMQENPRVARRTSGDYVIAWQSRDEDGDETGVYAQYFDPAGARVGRPFRVNTTTAGRQEMVVLAVNSAGKLVIVWDGNGPGDDLGIFAKSYRLSGGKP